MEVLVKSIHLERIADKSMVACELLLLVPAHHPLPCSAGVPAGLLVKPPLLCASESTDSLSVLCVLQNLPSPVSYVQQNLLQHPSCSVQTC
jgi:hypothetical protein